MKVILLMMLTLVVSCQFVRAQPVEVTPKTAILNKGSNRVLSAVPTGSFIEVSAYRSDPLQYFEVVGLGNSNYNIKRANLFLSLKFDTNSTTSEKDPGSRWQVPRAAYLQRHYGGKLSQTPDMGYDARAERITNVYDQEPWNEQVPAIGQQRRESFARE